MKSSEPIRAASYSGGLCNLQESALQAICTSLPRELHILNNESLCTPPDVVVATQPQIGQDNPLEIFTQAYEALT